ncbi:MAG TPA: TIGR01777 family oxidoreductase [Bryobacterales bacterium]|nr:TIGR01777 family oxidoreductase [Bryobacterales bacterium]
MRALVTGATGFIGRRLFSELDRPVALSRHPARARASLGSSAEIFGWDPEAAPPPKESLHNIDVVFHLAGESVGEGRWTPARKQLLRQSRVLSTRHLVDALASLDTRPQVFVCASAVGYYGDRGDEIVEETAPPGHDFLAELCQAWEAEAARARSFGVRVVSIRTGLVLGPSGGALARMLPPFHLGLGGRLGSGRQWMPWIHLDDLAGLYLHAAEKPGIDGPMNGVAPAPVTNAEFTKTLAAVLHRPAIFPVPAFALRLALGEFAGVLLASQRVAPRVAESTGYRFRYTALADALRSATGS